MLGDGDDRVVEVTEATPDDTFIMSPEEAAQMEQGYREYAEKVRLYGELINLEDDPARKQMLEGMVADVHEENK